MNKITTPLSRRTTATIIASCIVFIITLTSGSTDAYERGSPYYDPELQDGIPVMSAKSSMPAAWRDHNNGLKSEFEDNPMSSSRRRSSDADLEDNIEEDDDDDREDYSRAGSSNHDSYENPSFGESRRAAKDGDDIENFFDKHLGPPQDEIGASSDEIPISELSTGATPSLGTGPDYDDEYEAAASSPLSNIFHSILKAHKRPLVITTEESPSSTSDSSSTTKDKNQASSTAPIGLSIIKSGGSSQSVYANGSPLAYLTPMIASPSSISGYEQQDNNDQSQDDGVREIIITRRPASSLIGGYSSGGRLSHQSSNDHWRGAMAPNMRNPYDGEQSDYSRYPVAASYAYQREQQQQPEEQTVSYGLSFGAANDEDSNQDDQTSADDSPPPPSSQLAAASYPIYNSRYTSMRNSASMLRPYQNYQYQPMYNNPAMYNKHQQQQQYYQQQQLMQQHQQQQQQSPYHGARYHKDPSESIAQPVSYVSGGQYR